MSKGKMTQGRKLLHVACESPILKPVALGFLKGHEINKVLFWKAEDVLSWREQEHGTRNVVIFMA